MCVGGRVPGEVPRQEDRDGEWDDWNMQFHFFQNI